MAVTFATQKCQIICISVYNIYQHILLILCKINEEIFANVSINSEGSSEYIFVSSQDEWDDSDKDESTDNHRSVLIIPHLTDDR